MTREQINLFKLQIAKTKRKIFVCLFNTFVARFFSFRLKRRRRRTDLQQIRSVNIRDDLLQPPSRQPVQSVHGIKMIYNTGVQQSLRRQLSCGFCFIRLGQNAEYFSGGGNKHGSQAFFRISFKRLSPVTTCYHVSSVHCTPDSWLTAVQRFAKFIKDFYFLFFLREF